MARRQVRQNSTFPYHITDRCPNRELFRLNLDTVWNLLSDYLYLSCIKYGLKIYSFVLMPNHFHLIASSPVEKIGKVMCEFLCNSSKEMNRISGRLNQNWGDKYFKCELVQPLHLINTYKYVYQNPLRAKLCEKVEDWKYSSLNGLLGKSNLGFPVVEDGVLFNPSFQLEQLNWLNREISQTNYESIYLALRRTEFKLPKTKNRKLNPLEFERI